MDWLLIGLILLAILVNIRSFIVLSQFQQQRKQMLEDNAAIEQSMEEFVSNLETENEELYGKIAELIRTKEMKLDERIRVLEENRTALPVIEEPVTEQEASIENVQLDEDVPENEKIEQLFRQGFSAQQIAKVVEAERGEVELIINMYKKKQKYQK